MNKRGKDKRSFLTSTSFLLLMMLVGTAFFWFFGREPGVRNLPYGELMQMLQANDPALTLEKVRVGRSEIRGEIVTADTVSNGKSTTEKLVEKQAFRTRRPEPPDPELLKRLEKVGAAFQGEEEESPLKGVYSLLMSFVVLFAVVVAGFFLFRWLAGGSSPLTFGRSKHKLYAQKDLKITFHNY